MTLAGAVAELRTALDAAGLRSTLDPNGVAQPCTIIVPEGVPELSTRGQSPAGFRIVLVAGAFDAAASVEALLAAEDTLLSTLAALPHWGVGPLGPAGRIQLAGGSALAAAVTVSRQVDHPRPEE